MIGRRPRATIGDVNHDDLEAAGLPSLKNAQLRHMRQLFLAVVTGGFVVLVPWIVYLALVLPDHHPENAWNAAWVGFDVLLLLGLFVTTWGAWRRRQFVVVSCVFTATLLVCDAWFDITLDWGTSDETSALFSAFFAELPLAFYLFYAAMRIVRMTIRSALLLAGHPGPLPKFHKLSIGGVNELLKSFDAGREQPRPDHVE
jgi:hypothetical protein